MYKISEQQIEFILNDISARGVETEDLQYNLLDHVCCIIEQNLEADGDFENFYKLTIARFYKTELREIEEETKLLLTFKNYYVMRKIMLNSGIFAASILSIGLILKFMHWPGASVCIVLGLGAASLIFVPLLFTVRIKEKKENSDKILLAFGSIAGLLGIFHIMFKIQHWPGSMVLGSVAITFLLVLFLPIFIVTGIKNSDTKTNTIVTSIIIIIGCGLWLTLVVSPHTSQHSVIKNTKNYLRNEQLLKNEKRIVSKLVSNDTICSSIEICSDRIIDKCEELKTILIKGETGQESIDENFESKNAMLDDSFVNNYFDNIVSLNTMNELKHLIADYNKVNNNSTSKIPIKLTFLDSVENLNNAKMYNTLSELTQIQMFVLQQEQLKICAK